MPERRVILEAVRPVNDLAIGPDMGGASLRPINSGASLAEHFTAGGVGDVILGHDRSPKGRAWFAKGFGRLLSGQRGLLNQL